MDEHKTPDIPTDASGMCDLFKKMIPEVFTNDGFIAPAFFIAVPGQRIMHVPMSSEKAQDAVKDGSFRDIAPAAIAARGGTAYGYIDEAWLVRVSLPGATPPEKAKRIANSIHPSDDERRVEVVMAHFEDRVNAYLLIWDIDRSDPDNPVLTNLEETILKGTNAVKHMISASNVWSGLMPRLN